MGGAVRSLAETAVVAVAANHLATVDVAHLTSTRTRQCATLIVSMFALLAAYAT